MKPNEDKKISKNEPEIKKEDEGMLLNVFFIVDYSIISIFVSYMVK